MFNGKIFSKRHLKIKLMNKINKIPGSIIFMCGFMLISVAAFCQNSSPGSTTNSYPNMPLIAPIGERIDKYITVNESAKGPSIDPGAAMP